MTDAQPNRQEARAWAEKVAKSKPPRYTPASRNAAAVILADTLDDPCVVALEASLFAAELAESIGPSDEWSEDFKSGYIFGGRDAARTIRQKCTFPDAVRALPTPTAADLAERLKENKP